MNLTREQENKARRIAVHVENILNELHPEWNEDSEMEETPIRVAKAWIELIRGYSKPDFNMTAFPTKVEGMLVRPDIPFTSICAHHMLPYSGKCHVGLIYKDKKLGISKIIRAVQYWSARFTSQEELTDYIANQFDIIIKPIGVMVVTEAYHTCESIRGVRVPNVPTKYAVIRGAFKEIATRDEFYKLIGR